MAGLPELAEWLAAGAACSGAAYQIAAARLLGRLAAQPGGRPVSRPPVTLLKPLCGDEPGLEDNLRSFCLQDYPGYQIVLGVHDEADTALPGARRVAEAFPDRDIAIAVGSGRPATGNAKIANLLDMMPYAKHDILLVADSDTSVAPDFLAAFVAALEAPGVGIVTCLYTGHPEPNLWSRLGAMGVNHGFAPSVAVAEALGREDGCYGAAIALRRETLERIGGFGRFRDRLAEDYLLGAAIRELGLRIARAPAWARCRVHESDLGTLVDHEVRWGRTVASIDRAGYAGALVVHNIFWGLLALLLEGGPAGLGVFGLAFIARLWSVRSEERALGLAREPVWLVVTRDLLAMAVHLTALAGRTVRWRGRRMRIGPNGTLHPLGSAE